jgi:predicted alpha/beta superfamily hydrolase
MTKNAITTVLLILVAASLAYSQVPQTVPPQVEIRGTQLLHLTSEIVGQEYDLYVNLPRGYQDSGKTFPVIFLLDAQWDFPLAQAIFGEQYYDGFVPAAIIVGITWGGKSPNQDSLRARDLTPTNSRSLPQSGGGAKFLAFIKAELIPFVESRFRTAKNERTLMGSSFGGLFTLYALFHETELFNRYVLTSPSIGWDNGVLYTYEKEYAAKNSRLPVRVFMGVGALESGSVTEFERFVTQMRSRKYEGPELETRVLENTGHSGSKAEGYTRGLQAVFARPSLNLSHELLAQYVGKYRVNPQFVVEIVEEQGNLVMLAPGNTRIPLLAETEKEFSVRGTYLFLRFKKNEAGKVTGCEMELFSGKQSVEKID